jgi:hypothetical protein
VEKSHEVDQASSVRPRHGCSSTLPLQSSVSVVAMASRARHVAEQRRSSVSNGEEEKWERPPVVPTCGIRPVSPRGTVATNGV